MQNTNLRLYATLARWSPLKSFQGKIFLVAFLGTHVPLLALLTYFIVVASLNIQTTVRVLVVALAATLAGTAMTLYLLYRLLAPIALTSKGLRDYLATSRLPDLPTEFTDE